MDIYRKIAILIIIICASYIIFRLIQKRGQITFQLPLPPPSPPPSAVEGFSLPSLLPSETSELAKMTLHTPPDIHTMDITKSNLPICQYVIKSSYNTPCTGSYMNLDAINYILSRGCRFLDLEIYMIDSKVCVASSNNPKKDIISSNNNLLLDDVFNQISLNAFQSSTASSSLSSPNPKDPLFLQLRIQSPDPKIFKLIAMSIHKNLKKHLYCDENGNPIHIKPTTTKISDLMGKLVLIVDKKIAPDWTSFPECNSSDDPCYNLSNYVNMIAGSSSLKTSSFIDILEQCTHPYTINDDGITADITTMQITVPPTVSTNSQNIKVLPLISKYGNQITCFQFWKTGEILANYEMLFSENKSAFVSFAQIDKMINQLDMPE